MNIIDMFGATLDNPEQSELPRRRRWSDVELANLLESAVLQLRQLGYPVPQKVHPRLMLRSEVLDSLQSAWANHGDQLPHDTRNAIRSALDAG